MITVKIEMTDHLITQLKASGHAQMTKKGVPDPVCIAVTVILRTTASLLLSDGIGQVEVSAPAAGELFWRLLLPPKEKRERLRGIFAVTLNALVSLEEEFPEALRIDINLDEG